MKQLQIILQVNHTIFDKEDAEDMDLNFLVKDYVHNDEFTILGKQVKQMIPIKEKEADHG